MVGKITMAYVGDQGFSSHRTNMQETRPLLPCAGSLQSAVQGEGVHWSLPTRCQQQRSPFLTFRLAPDVVQCSGESSATGDKNIPAKKHCYLMWFMSCVSPANLSAITMKGINCTLSLVTSLSLSTINTS